MYLTYVYYCTIHIIIHLCIIVYELYSYSPKSAIKLLYDKYNYLPM